MADIVFSNYEGDVVRVDGKCYYYIGLVKEPVTTDPSEIEGVFSDCEECAVVSSSSSGSSSSGGFSESSSSGGNSESSSSGGNSESSSSGGFSESSSSGGVSESSSSEGFSESSSSSSEGFSESSSSSGGNELDKLNCSGNTFPRCKITICWTGSGTSYPFMGGDWSNGESKIVCPDTYRDGSGGTLGTDTQEEFWQKVYSATASYDMYLHANSNGGRQGVGIDTHVSTGNYANLLIFKNHSVSQNYTSYNSNTVSKDVSAGGLSTGNSINMTQFGYCTFNTGGNFGNVTIKWSPIAGQASGDETWSNWKATGLTYTGGTTTAACP